MDHLWRLWHDEEGQDIAEYAVMLAVILVIVVGTIRLIGSNANNVFSNVASCDLSKRSCAAQRHRGNPPRITAGTRVFARPDGAL